MDAHAPTTLAIMHKMDRFAASDVNKTDRLAVSVVISVRNRVDMLGDCLRGLGEQTLDKSRFEVVVIDNFSTDNLSPVVDAARATFGLQIQFARTTQDRGPAPARNLGVEMAHGAIIAFTDSDCRPVPQWLALGLAAFDEPEVGMVSGPILPKPEQSVRFTTKVSFVTRSEHPTFPTANLMVRRSVFMLLGGFDVSLSVRDVFNRATECADTDLAWRLIKAGHQRRFVNEAVIHHELEAQTLVMWLLEPTRLFLLPELVRRHPELRQTLLTAKIIFYPPALSVYVGLLLVFAAVMWMPRLLWLVPLIILGRAVQRTRTFDIRVLLRFSVRAPLHFLRMLILNLSLLYGSVRYRTLVL